MGSTGPCLTLRNQLRPSSTASYADITDNKSASGRRNNALAVQMNNVLLMTQAIVILIVMLKLASNCKCSNFVTPGAAFGYTNFAVWTTFFSSNPICKQCIFHQSYVSSRLPVMQVPISHFQLAANMRVLVGDETGLLKSIELEKNEQRILSSRDQPQARSRSIQRLCWYADERETADFQRNVVMARADGVVESYEASHGKSLSASKEPDWSWTASDKEQSRTRCVGLDVINKFGSVVQCSDTGDVLVRSTLEDAGKPATFNVGGD
ncbi:hypothetical protein GQ600_26553 [Phytophthora cactorum]|nr:hypothetical protein GQ600_26553 [Phytophthora cactorum]